MYRGVDVLRAYARQTEPKVYRPFIMTEYLHTMGNSGGGPKEYMDVFESEPIARVAVFGIGWTSLSAR